MLSDKTKKRIVFFCNDKEKLKTTLHHLQSEGANVEVWDKEPPDVTMEQDHPVTLFLISIEYEKKFGSEFKKRIQSEFSKVQIINFDEDSHFSTFSKNKRNQTETHKSSGSRMTPEELLDLLTLTIQPREVNIGHNDELEIFYFKKCDFEHEFYYIFAMPGGAVQSLDKVKKILRNLIDLDASEEKLISHLGFKLSKFCFEETSKNAKHKLEGQVQGQDLYFSYVVSPLVKNNGLELKVKNKMCSVQIQDWWSHMPIPVNMFIYLELNNKIILYLRRGAILSSQDMKVLKRKTYGNMWIEASDVKKYFQLQSIMSL